MTIQNETQIECLLRSWSQLREQQQRPSLRGWYDYIQEAIEQTVDRIGSLAWREYGGASHEVAIRRYLRAKNHG